MRWRAANGRGFKGMFFYKARPKEPRTGLLGLLVILLLGCQGGGPAATGEPPAPSKPPAKMQEAVPPGALSAVSAPSPQLMPFDEGRLKMAGGLDARTFKRVMEKRRSSFKVCYKKALDENPQAKGEVRVSFGISPTGRVSTVEVIESSLPSAEAVDCIVRVIRRVQFPPLETGQWAQVQYPLTFAP